MEMMAEPKSLRDSLESVQHLEWGGGIQQQLLVSQIICRNSCRHREKLAAPCGSWDVAGVTGFPFISASIQESCEIGQSEGGKVSQGAFHGSKCPNGIHSKFHQTQKEKLASGIRVVGVNAGFQRFCPPLHS